MSEQNGTTGLFGAVEACVAALAITAGMGIIAVCLMVLATRRARVASQAGLLVMGAIVALFSAPVGMLTAHRLLWDDWWPFWGTLASHGALVTPSGTGMNCEDVEDHV